MIFKEIRYLYTYILAFTYVNLCSDYTMYSALKLYRLVESLSDRGK